MFVFVLIWTSDSVGIFFEAFEALEAFQGRQGREGLEHAGCEGRELVVKFAEFLWKPLGVKPGNPLTEVEYKVLW